MKNKISINNNIFGLILKRIKIKSFPKDKNGDIIISLYSYLEENLIKENEYIDKNKEIEFYFPQSEISAGNYIIEYAGVVTEPDFDKYNLYCDIDEDNGNINEEKKEFKRMDYIGRTGNINLLIKNQLTNKCKNLNCSYCIENYLDECLIYKKLEEKNEGLDEKRLAIIYEKLKQIINEKSFEGENIVIDMKNVLMQLSTVDFQEENINEKNVTNVFLGECKEILKEKYDLKDDEVLLMIKLDLFKQNLSTPLVEYEIYNYNNSEKLNLEYCKDININVFVPIQLDNKTIILYNNLNQSGYNLFNSNDSFYTDICSIYTTFNGTDISLIDRQKDYYNQSLILCQEGCTYDYYDNDTHKVKCICPVSKTSVGGDSILYQEKNNFISTIIEIYNDKEKLKQIFSSSIKNMNFKVMKCYQLVFNLENFMNNIGSILLTILILIFLFLMILYFVSGNKILKEMFKRVVNKKSGGKKRSIVHFKLNEEIKENKRIKRRSQLYDETKTKKEIKLKKNRTFIENESNNKLVLNTIGEKTDFNEQNKKNLKNKDISVFERRKKKVSTVKMIKPIKLKLNSPPPKLGNQQLFKRHSKKSRTVKENITPKIIKNNSLESNFKYYRRNKDNEFKNKYKLDLRDSGKSANMSGSEIVLHQRNSSSYYTNSNFKKNKKLSRFVSKEKSSKETKDEIDLKDKNNENNKMKIKFEDLNDLELNELDYGTAIIIDKRTYFQYYWSLLKKKHLILFCFLPSNDYNISIIKISFFIISFSLYMTINGFFFSDETMHKVYEDNGKFNFIYQIPQILYSSLVSLIIHNILKYLSLSEKSILKMKKESNMRFINGKLEEIKKCLKIKLFIYFIFGFILMVFFWYFISSFCAVYPNTQEILIKNTLLSFLMSMIYPFGYTLIPGLFRIPALRAKNQDQEFIYKMSKIIALI